MPTLGNGKIKIETWGEVYIVVRKSISQSDWLFSSRCLSAIAGTRVVAGVVACASVVAGIVACTSVVAGTSVIAGVVVLRGKQENSVILLVMPLKK